MKLRLCQQPNCSFWEVSKAGVEGGQGSRKSYSAGVAGRRAMDSYFTREKASALDTV